MKGQNFLADLHNYARTVELEVTTEFGTVTQVREKIEIKGLKHVPNPWERPGLQRPQNVGTLPTPKRFGIEPRNLV